MNRRWCVATRPQPTIPTRSVFCGRSLILEVVMGVSFRFDLMLFRDRDRVIEARDPEPLWPSSEPHAVALFRQSWQRQELPLLNYPQIVSAKPGNFFQKGTEKPGAGC